MEFQITDKALKIMKFTEWKLCNRCLGRKFSKLISAPDNENRGEYVRQILKKSNYEGENNSGNADSCYICNNIFDQLEDGYLDYITKYLEESEVEFSTFLVGCRVLPEIISKEEQIQKYMDLDVENIKKEINREIGKRLSAALQKEVDFEKPDIIIIIDLINDDINIQINPIFIEGRYRKLLRGIPQTKWPCRECKGKGCKYCNYTGKLYPESVEELISEDLIRTTRGKAAKFHGAGREDIDVRMLGNGRPFVLEIKEPKIRSIDLEELQNKINYHAAGKVEISNLDFVEKERRSIIKNSSTETYKTYRAIIELEKEVYQGDLALLDSMKVINQRTPVRVSHRRADKIRERRIKRIETKIMDSRYIEMIIECQGGLYIKELIDGDQDRTTPSVSEVLKTRAKCMKLDVLDVNI